MKLLVFLFLAKCMAQVQRASRVGLQERNAFAEDLSDFFSCKRLFTKNEAVGCASDSRSGDFGSLFHIQNLDDLVSLENSDIDKRAVIITQEFFESDDIDVLTRLAEIPDKVSVLFLEDATVILESANEGFSQSDINRQLIPFPVALLNKTETDLVLNFEEENPKRKDGYENKLWQAGALLDFYNGQADVTSSYCLELGRCDPVGGMSVYSSMGAELSTEKPIILFAINLDASGLFHDLSFAANSAAASLTVMLSVAHAIRTSAVFAQLDTFERQLMFAAFQGETFGGIGSAKFIFDITYGCFTDTVSPDSGLAESCVSPPLYSAALTDVNMDQFEEVISLDNIASYSTNVNLQPMNYFIHTTGAAVDTANGFAQELTNVGFTTNVLENNDFSQLRSNAAMNFTQEAGFNGIGVVIAGYSNQQELKAVNPGLFSRVDKRAFQSVADTTTLQNLATGVARTLLARLGDVPIPTVADVEADFTYVQALESCLTLDFACDLVLRSLNMTRSEFERSFQRNIKTNQHPPLPSPPLFFPGVYRPNVVQSRTAPQGIEFFVRNMLAALSAPASPDEILSHIVNGTDIQEEVGLACVSDSQCSQLYVSFEESTSRFNLSGQCTSTRNSSMSCVASRCICSTTFYHDAFPLSLQYVGGEAGFAERAGSLGEVDTFLTSNDPAFTEPRYELPTARTFQESNATTEVILLVMGLLSTCATFFTVNRLVTKLKTSKYKLD